MEESVGKSFLFHFLAGRWDFPLFHLKPFTQLPAAISWILEFRYAFGKGGRSSLAPGHLPSRSRRSPSQSLIACTRSFRLAWSYWGCWVAGEEKRDIVVGGVGCGAGAELRTSSHFSSWYLSRYWSFPRPPVASSNPTEGHIVRGSTLTGGGGTLAGQAAPGAAAALSTTLWALWILSTRVWSTVEANHCLRLSSVSSRRLTLMPDLSKKSPTASQEEARDFSPGDFTTETGGGEALYWGRVGVALDPRDRPKGPSEGDA
mmetsp:Transcript_11230/g.31296  ORF Transcript_11230/g.31296 Transcript_11230/m.31296 type:complete len:260 (-) Transcript_11230:289-1068(-)